MAEVTLEMMLACRERRAETQRRLILQFGKPVISFTMNIAGPVKTGRLTERGFLIGLDRLKASLIAEKIRIEAEEVSLDVTGPEAFLAADADASVLKSICVGIEDGDRLGRLFDMDVISPDGKKQEREEERTCLICGRRAKECASRRLHSVEELQKTTEEILYESVCNCCSDRVASLAVKALIIEAAAAPKPGLVDRFNNGSHNDMNLFTFIGSAAILYPYFKSAYSIGFGSSDKKKCFDELRKKGMEAERAMFAETGGINTHKGAVFSLGTVCCAVGFCERNGGDIFECCSAMAEGIVGENLQQKPMTAGQKLLAEYGVKGAREELAAGLPSVKNIGLPYLEFCLSKGLDLEEAGVNALLKLIPAVSDTNLVSRGGFALAKEAGKRAGELVSDGFADMAMVRELDRWFIENNLSPGGAADLLSICYFLHFMKEARLV